MKRSANAEKLLTKVELAVLAQRNLAQLEDEVRESSEPDVLRARGERRAAPGCGRDPADPPR
jgi:hypothetical protein